MQWLWVTCVRCHTILMLRYCVLDVPVIRIPYYGILCYVMLWILYNRSSYHNNSLSHYIVYCICCVVIVIPTYYTIYIHPHIQPQYLINIYLLTYILHQHNYLPTYLPYSTILPTYLPFYFFIFLYEYCWIYNHTITTFYCLGSNHYYYCYCCYYCL